MQRGSRDQLTFVAVARQRSFTGAAAKQNVSQSALKSPRENSKSASELGS
jgi:hypothetical protein